MQAGRSIVSGEPLFTRGRSWVRRSACSFCIQASDESKEGRDHVETAKLHRARRLRVSLLGGTSPR